jgi:glycine/D-amino acid oxidase-like deaminating enzyme
MNKRILILGGGLAGCLAAKFFLDKGANVTIIDRQEIGKSFVVAKNHVSFHAHEKMWCATQPVKVVKRSTVSINWNKHERCIAPRSMESTV